MKWPQNIIIKEVGPRDGLQNEKTFVSTENKICWINELAQTGLTYIEITSFVSPKWISALSDAKEVAKGIERKDGVTYAALVPNLKGLQRALETDIDEISIFMSVSETHNKKNINKSIKDTIPVLKEVAEEALAEGKTVRAYLSTVFGCPYEGKVETEKVLRITETLFEIGIDECSLGDTIGVANPRQVQDLLCMLLRRFPQEKIAMHFHNTYGRALANIVASMEIGITRFDGATGGIGGCPYAPGASGNVATEDIVNMLESMGIDCGVDQNKLRSAALFIENCLGHPLHSHCLQVFRTKQGDSNVGTSYGD